VNKYDANTRRRIQWILAGCCFLDMIGFGLILPLLPIYSRELGATPFENGMILAIFPITHLLMASVIGAWSDRVGRKLPLLISAFGMVVTYALSVFMHNVVELAILRFVAAFFTSAEAVCFAAMSDITTKEERSHGMALLGAAASMGFVLGPALAGFTVSMGIHVPFLIASLCSLVYALTVLFFLPDIRGTVEQPQIARPTLFGSLSTGFHLVAKTPVLWITILLIAAAAAGRVGWEGTFGLFLTGHASPIYDERTFSWLLTIVGVTSVTLQLIVLPRIKNRFSEFTLIVVGGSGFAIGCGLLATSQKVEVMIPALIGIGFGFGLFSPSAFSVLSKMIPEGSTGAIMGVAKATSYTGRALAVSAAGLLFQIDASLPIVGAGVVNALCVVAVPVLVAMGVFREQVTGAACPCPLTQEGLAAPITSLSRSSRWEGRRGPRKT